MSTLNVEALSIFIFKNQKVLIKIVLIYFGRSLYFLTILYLAILVHKQLHIYVNTGEKADTMVTVYGVKYFKNRHIATSISGCLM